ncbi:MAG: AAA family ATPase [Candidatus Zixiibacteriota bacterium]|nr:MAG: AAA family ATPase [candidate division Zixibacteria bacterium]
MMATVDSIRRLLGSGESISVEFKESSIAIPQNTYETVCSFLNRHGGKILLGIDDSGTVLGIEPELIPQLKQNFVNTINNPDLLTPTYYLSIETIEIDDKKILYVFVPESSQVHRCRNRIYDRNEDGDFDITDNSDLVSALYQRKQTTFSENEILPHITMDNFDSSIIHRVRKMAVNNRANHPWQDLDDESLLQSSGLFRTDFRAGDEGYTLASVLLFGKDEVILSVLPHHRTDAILRKVNLDRYDDRDDIRTNLIDSFDRLMAFGQKHLPDPFYEEKSQRISARDKIIRELASNILIHREYRNPYHAKFIIEKERIFAENSNRPHGHGRIDPQNFSPFPKNPVIAGVFKEIGRADELGSGTRNLMKYGKLYSEQPVELLENDVFNTIVHISSKADLHGTMQDTMQDTMQAEHEKKVLAFCRTERTRKEIQEHLGLKNRDHFRKQVLNPMIDKGLLSLTIPEKPTSRNQKYITVAQDEPE